MKLEAEQVLCRFHLTNVVRHGAEPMYQWIVETARREELQGGSVLKGFMGLRWDGAILHDSPWRLSQELPVIVEVVDGPGSVGRLLARVEPALRQAAVTLERAHVALYRVAGAGASPRDAAGRYEVVATKRQATAGEVKTMATPEDGVLMRIFLGEGDRDREHDRPLYETIVRRAHDAHLAGATVLKGPMGFGRHSRLHTSGLLELSTDLPVVVEIVDAEEKINAFIPVVDELVSEGMVTLEAVRLLRYGGKPGA